MKVDVFPLLFACGTIPIRMARRPDPREVEMLSRENLEELRHNLAHLSLGSHSVMGEGRVRGGWDD